MSVNATTYVMYGYWLELDTELGKTLREQYWKYRDDNDDEDSYKGINIVSDSMGGKYIVIGKILDSADEYEGLRLSISPEDIRSLWREIEVPIGKWLPIGQKITEDVLPKLHIFIHYS